MQELNTMRRYKNLIIIGTSHISPESVKEVEKLILEKRPDIVALELDLTRFKAMVYNEKRKLSLKDIKNIGIKGYLFNLIGAWVEKQLGKLVGVKPGAEMKNAVKAAIFAKSKIALIDQDIKITLRKLSKSITWKEKFNFIADLISAPFKKQVKFDLKKVPDKKLIKQLIKQVKDRYPSFYKVLIKERNEIMAKHLYKLMHDNKDVVAIVGAGHEDEIINLIKKEK